MFSIRSMNRTSIMISKSFAKKLASFGKKGDSYQRIIENLIKEGTKKNE